MGHNGSHMMTSSRSTNCTHR